MVKEETENINNLLEECHRKLIETTGIPKSCLSETNRHKNVIKSFSQIIHW